MSIIFGECDCCQQSNRVLHRGEAAGGLEAYACAECRYTDPRDEAYEIEEELDACREDPNRHGAGDHRTLLIANLEAELARIVAMAAQGNRFGPRR